MVRVHPEPIIATGAARAVGRRGRGLGARRERTSAGRQAPRVGSTGGDGAPAGKYIPIFLYIFIYIYRSLGVCVCARERVCVCLFGASF